MQIIILTGTIGSGKSTVAAILKDLGAVVIDSDDVARHVIDQGNPAYREVLAIFGPEILDKAGNIDRKKLAARVFNNPQALSQLNQIIHPRVDDHNETLFEKYNREGEKVVFIEMAFLASPGWIDRVEQIWLVKTSSDIALKRLEQRGLSRSESIARLANQPDPESQVKNKLVVITNDGSRDQLKMQVVELWNKMFTEGWKY